MTGIITKAAKPIGFCIKFLTYDEGPILTHWFEEIIENFTLELQAYLNQLESSFLIEINENPKLKESLDENHPYFMQLNNAPELTSYEIGDLQDSSIVEGYTFSTNDNGLLLTITFRDAHQVVIQVHEYLVATVYGYILNMVKALASEHHSHESIN